MDMDIIPFGGALYIENKFVDPVIAMLEAHGEVIQRH